MIIGDIYFEGYYPPGQMIPGEYEDIYFYVENIGDEVGDIWVDHYRNGILIKDSIEVLLSSGRVHLFTPGYVIQGEGQAEYEIRVGHFTNYPSGKTQDGLLYFVIEEEILACGDYTTQTECEAAGCYWYNNSCHATAPICANYTTQTECVGAGCYWCDGACQSTPCGTVCSDYTTQTECVANGCYWWDNACHNTEEPQPPLNLIPYIAIGGIAIAVIAVIIIKKKAR